MLDLSPEASESALLAVEFIFTTQSGSGRPSAECWLQCLSKETLGRAVIWASRSSFPSEGAELWGGRLTELIATFLPLRAGVGSGVEAGRCTDLPSDPERSRWAAVPYDAR